MEIFSLSDFDSLNEEDAVRNNQLAFDTAEREFGILPVITGKEMASAAEPDKLSMVMYLSKFYELFRGTPLRAFGKLTYVALSYKRNDEGWDGFFKSVALIYPEIEPTSQLQANCSGLLNCI